MGRLNRSLSSRYRAARRAGWRRRACEVERVAFHDIGRILVKLSVEHAHAVPNLARVSELVRQVRSSTPAANGHECASGSVDPGPASV